MDESSREEKLLILPLNDKYSKRISRVLANDTSRKILEALCEEALTATEISEKLDLPLTTLHYNIENLMEAGLIKVARTRYSEKGREVKYYEPTRKFIVIAPGDIGEEEVRSTLKKVLFGVYFLFASAISGYAFQRIYYYFWRMEAAVPMVMRAAAEAEKLPMEEAPAAPLMLTPAPSPTVEAVPRAAERIGPNLVIWFVFGAVFALVLLFVWRKIGMRWKTEA